MQALTYLGVHPARFDGLREEIAALRDQLVHEQERFKGGGVSLDR